MISICANNICHNESPYDTIFGSFIITFFLIVRQSDAPSGAGNKENTPLQFDVRIQSIRPGDSIKGTASVNINGAFAIRGIKIIEGSNGLFVSMPSYKAGNEYKDICFPITQECRKQLHEAVIGAYEQAISQGQDTVAKHHGMQAPEGQPMEMAGM